MTSFRLPRWVIERLDRVRRNFLWGKNDGQGQGISLINWKTVCSPRDWGGLGVSDLNLQNIALLLRWWWTAYTKRDALWSKMIDALKGIALRADRPCFWSKQGSFFWRNLHNIKPIFHWSAFWSVGDGSKVSFWYDSWKGLPLKGYYDNTTRPPLQRISLQEAIPIAHDLVPDMQDIMNVLSTEDSDSLQWRWGSHGAYTAKSAYRVIIGGKDKMELPGNLEM